MATFKNESAETFVFPSLGLTVEPGESFDADVEITTAGITSGVKKKVDSAPADSAPAEPAAAVETPAPVEEVK